jgi:DNA-damage-inducible protein D
MKSESLVNLTESFEDHVNITVDQIEFWLARDLQYLLGYSEWRNFQKVIIKAKQSCEASGNDVFYHFVEINKMVKIGSDSERPINDLMLTRYACYLIAQNGDPKKEEIAFAQNYFAVQTRKFEILEKRIKDWERLQARKKLTASEKDFSKLIFEKTGNERSFAIIRSKGDTALFGITTKRMKEKLSIPPSRTLADFLPTITIKAKDFATEITIFNIKDKNLKSDNNISKEHITNNTSVRNILLERGIKPEELPAEEDLKKLERRINKENKRIENISDRFNQKLI